MYSNSTNHFPSKSVLPRYSGSKLSFFFPFSASSILVTSLGAPKLGLYKPFIITHDVYKFQLYKSSGFWVINETINFQVKISRFLCFFCVSIHYHVTYRIPKIGTYDAFNNSYVESKFQLPTCYRLLVMRKSILICQNSRTKTKELRAHAKSQLAYKSHCKRIWIAQKIVGIYSMKNW